MEMAEKVDFLMEVAESFERAINRMNGQIHVQAVALKCLYENASEEAKSAVKLNLLALVIASKEPNPDFMEGVLMQARIIDKDMI